MRKALLILAILLTSWAAMAQEHPFMDGEEVRWSVMFKWGAFNTEVGKAQFSVDSLFFRGSEAYHIGCTVKSAPFFDRFYKIREDLQSWVRADDLRPIRFTRDTYEGGYTATNDYNYNWDKGVIEADINFENKGEQRLEIPVKEGEFDLISLVFNIRSLPESAYRKGETTLVRFAIDDAVFDVHIKSYGEEVIKVRKMGKMKGWHLACSVVQGALFEGDEDLHLWLSADKNRIPIAAKVPLRVGAVQAWLCAYSGLKYPFEAYADGRKR